MVKYLNRQNKHNYALFREDGRFDNYDGQISWTDMLMLRHMDKLNKRVYKLSPRRGTRANPQAINEFFGLKSSTAEFLDHLAEVLDEST